MLIIFPSKQTAKSPLGQKLLAVLHNCTYNLEVQFEWDPKKAATNHRKHGGRFADAQTVFEDEMAITIKDEHPDEERFVTMGLDALGRVVVVVFAWRDQSIRIISARKATPRERNEYGA